MKRSELAEYIKETIVEVLSEESLKPEEAGQYAKDMEDAADAAERLTKALATEDIEDTEKAEKEVTVNPDDSVTKISSELQKNAVNMKTVLNKWKKAEGEEKAKLLNRLKELTKIKNELEGLL